MILGFTGTRTMPTEQQRQFIRSNMFYAQVLRHGCCVGSDYAAHQAAIDVGVPTIWLHPPKSDRWMVPMGRLMTRGGIRALPPKSYHDRDRDVVDECHVLIATPNGPRRKGSGTWYTIDYARSVDKPVVVCLPDGEIDPVNSTYAHLKPTGLL